MLELPSPGQFFAALVFWAAAATVVFWHADRRGNKNATRWGVATFLFGPVALPLYFIRHWLRRRRS